MNGNLTGLAPIKKSKLLIVEGQDEINFFKQLLASFNNDAANTRIDYRNAGGVRQFHNILPALTKVTGFDKVNTLAIIRDAEENNAESAFQSIIHILNDLDFEDLPSQVGIFGNGDPRIGVFIMPDNREPGMLENLCLDAVKRNPIMGCVDSYISCLSYLKSIEQPRNIPKTKVQAYLAAMPEIANSLGVGALKNYWDFSSSIFGPIKDFLNEFLN